MYSILSQRHLRLALAAGRMLGKDVQDQRGPVDDLDLDGLLQRGQLRRDSSPSQITVSAPVARTTSRTPDSCRHGLVDSTPSVGELALEDRARCAASPGCRPNSRVSEVEYRQLRWNGGVGRV